MRKFGLIGKQLGYSFSPEYFSKKFENASIVDAEYKAYELDSVEAFLDLISDELVGLNVTIPYKESVIPYLDELDSSALDVMAVNTIKNLNGVLCGYNTDTFGFEKSLLQLLGDSRPERALILGSGGASKAVQFVLERLQISFDVVSRSGVLNYDKLNAELISKCQLLVNTTPLGTYPNVEECPSISYEGIGSNHFVFDLIYNPEKTLFLKRAEAQGAKISNGHQMLIFQAEKSWEIWNQ